MPGSVKKRVERLRAQGDEAMADWLERKEQARVSGEVLWKWEKDNPRPTPTSATLAGGDSNGKERVRKKINRFRDEIEFNEDVIPESVQGLIDEIRVKKKDLKGKIYALDKVSDADAIKTGYKVLRRLDAEEKKLIFEYDFKAFDDYLFQDLQDRVETARFHYEMVGLYRNFKRACVVCPRGHAKSTTARKYILHQVLYGKAKYCVIVGSSEDMAAQNLRWVRDQMIDNERVLQVYGYLKNKDKWADTEFQTLSGVKVVAKGAGQKIRGANEKGRPDLIYIDDLEEDEQVSSKDRRSKLSRWFTQALLPAKSRTGRVIITGTILHMDSLLKNISENKVKDHIDWEVLWYQAIELDESGEEKALWEEHKPLSELQALRLTDPETFAQEYQNNPASGAMGVFNRDEYQYIQDTDIKVEDYSGKVYVRDKLVNVLFTTDLAVSEREGTDYTVFMVTGMDTETNLYVLEYERFRSSDPYEQIEMLFEMMSRWHCDSMTMEEVGFQKTFKRILEFEMEKRSKYFYIHEMKRTNVRKIFRVKGLKGPIKAGKLYWQYEHTDIEEELGQVTTTSLGVHDDVIDALSDAWEVQIEMIEDIGRNEIKINTVEWAIDEGLFPTAVEQGYL